MVREIIDTCLDVVGLLFNKVLLFFSFVIGLLLSNIGYPKEILIFILTLIVIDLLTKQYAMTKVRFNDFTLENYIKAWKCRVLTSRELKNGLCVKAFLYFPVLYIAHNASILPQIIYGETMSNIIYTLLILVECSSIIENFILAGYDVFKPILKFIKKKENELIDCDDKSNKED